MATKKATKETINTICHIPTCSKLLPMSMFLEVVFSEVRVSDTMLD